MTAYFTRVSILKDENCEIFFDIDNKYREKIEIQSPPISRFKSQLKLTIFVAVTGKFGDTPNLVTKICD